jgi:hypothetical protein
MEKPISKRHGKAGYIAALIVNVILIYVFNNLLKWNVPFLTSDFSGVLWAINLSLGVTILINFLWLMFDPAWFRHLGQIVLNLIAIFVLFLFFAVFPFTFAAEAWAFWVKVALIALMACVGIATIVEFFKLILGKD